MERVALVTGKSRGIGEAISEALKAKIHEAAARYAGNDAKSTTLMDETGLKTITREVADDAVFKADIGKFATGPGSIDVVAVNSDIPANDISGASRLGVRGNRRPDPGRPLERSRGNRALCRVPRLR